VHGIDEGNVPSKRSVKHIGQNLKNTLHGSKNDDLGKKAMRGGKDLGSGRPLKNVQQEKKNKTRGLFPPNGLAKEVKRSGYTTVYDLTDRGRRNLPID